jgi:GxxExxY protein
MIDDELTRQIIDSAIAVHRELGPGLLESTYRTCLCYELGHRGIAFLIEPLMDLKYKDLTVAKAYRADLIVEREVIIELKHIEKILPVHESQLRTYLRLSGLKTGLLLNFNSSVMKDGIRRLPNPKFSPAPKLPKLPANP